MASFKTKQYLLVSLFLFSFSLFSVFLVSWFRNVLHCFFIILRLSIFFCLRINKQNMSAPTCIGNLMGNYIMASIEVIVSKLFLQCIITFLPQLHLRGYCCRIMV